MKADVQLTFNTLINVFRFTTYRLGGAKVKNVCFTKLTELKKNVCHFLNFPQNFLKFFLVKDLTNHFFFTRSKLWRAHFFTRMQRLKNGWPLSAPPRAYAYFYHPQLPKFWWKLISNSFHQKKFQKFWCKLKRNTSHIRTQWAESAPLPRMF